MKNNDLPIDITVFLELDPLSDRYPVCPNCRKLHMVRNKGRDFCRDKCANQHYNARRRLGKQVRQQSPFVVASKVAAEQEFTIGSVVPALENEKCLEGRRSLRSGVCGKKTRLL